jgi:hypothetical protein
MTKRSLKASPSGVEQAKKAFERKGWTQEYLAAEVGLQISLKNFGWPQTIPAMSGENPGIFCPDASPLHF